MVESSGLNRHIGTGLMNDILEIVQKHLAFYARIVSIYISMQLRGAVSNGAKRLRRLISDSIHFPATPTKWKYRAIYRLDDAQVGLWSAEVSVTVGGDEITKRALKPHQEQP
jgi:hypothetical protein